MSCLAKISSDENIRPGQVVADVTYYYWLEVVDIHGRATRHGPVSATVPPDSPYRLYLPVVFDRRWPTESTTC
jgi:hypothetical protein